MSMNTAGQLWMKALRVQVPHSGLLAVALSVSMTFFVAGSPDCASAYRGSATVPAQGVHTMKSS